MTKNIVNHNKSMRVEIGHLFKNDFFGEGVVVSRKSTRRATGTAIVDTLCLVLPASSTKRLFGNSLATTLGRIYLQRKQADDDERGVEMVGSDFQALKLLGRDRTENFLCSKFNFRQNVRHEKNLQI